MKLRTDITIFFKSYDDRVQFSNIRNIDEDNATYISFLFGEDIDLSNRAVFKLNNILGYAIEITKVHEVKIISN